MDDDWLSLHGQIVRVAVTLDHNDLNFRSQGEFVVRLSALRAVPQLHGHTK